MNSNKIIYFGTLLACLLCFGCADNISPTTCGNNKLDEGEVCDGNLFKNNNVSCSHYDNQKAWVGTGKPECNSTCDGYTQGTCTLCGNNVLDDNEMCDGELLRSGINCYTLEHKNWAPAGKPACNSTCDGIETGTCSMCGNNMIDNGEICDSFNINGLTCSEFDPTHIWNANGQPVCGNDCRSLVQGSCVLASDVAQIKTEVCGNNIIEGDEVCENNTLNNKTCKDLNPSKLWSLTGSPVCIQCQLAQGTCKEAELLARWSFDVPANVGSKVARADEGFATSTAAIQRSDGERLYKNTGVNGSGALASNKWSSLNTLDLDKMPYWKINLSIPGYSYADLQFSIAGDGKNTGKIAVVYTYANDAAKSPMSLLSDYELNDSHFQNIALPVGYLIQNDLEIRIYGYQFNDPAAWLKLDDVIVTGIRQ